MTSLAERGAVTRDCQHTGTPHEHGTVTAYWRDRCSCGLCRAANTAHKLEYRRLRAEGCLPYAGQTSAVGTQRRLAALMCVGYSLRVLADEIDRQPANIHRIFRQDSVSRLLAAEVAELYEQLSTSDPAATNRSERQSVHRTRALAHRRGYLGPWQWIDVDIDDPAAKPVTEVLDDVLIQRACDGLPAPGMTRAERAEAARRMHAAGMLKSQIARRLNMNGNRINDILGAAA